jgi:septum formation protein
MKNGYSASKIYLASASPRRRNLLSHFGLEFEVFPSNLHEVHQKNEAPVDYVTRVAHDKAEFVAKLVNELDLVEHPVLGADTEVVLEGEILGKPGGRDHGIEMLRLLSGRTHEVLSAICVIARGKEYAALSTSLVTFASITDEEIAQYWDSGEPADKAGAYAIQGRAGGFITKLEGSYSAVMGLPLYELAVILKKIRGSSA